MKNEKTELETQRSDSIFLLGELQDLYSWLDRGYKADRAKDVVLKMIEIECNDLKRHARELFDLIAGNKSTKNNENKTD